MRFSVPFAVAAAVAGDGVLAAALPDLGADLALAIGAA